MCRVKMEKEYNYYDETKDTKQKRYNKEVFKNSVKYLFKLLGLLLSIGVISYIYI